MPNQTGENGAHGDAMLTPLNGTGQGLSPALWAKIERSIKNNGDDPSLAQLAQQHLESLCRKFASDIQAGRITRQHMKMFAADTTGVDIGLLA